MRGAGCVNRLTDEGEVRVKAAYHPSYERLPAPKGRRDPAGIFRSYRGIARARPGSEKSIHLDAL
jgi:hypothetical protein